MSNVERDDDVVARGVSRLIVAFQSKPRIVALLTSYLKQVQDVKTAAYDFYADRMLSSGNITTDLLNKLGKLVGQNREGFDNDTYKLLITARIAANRSDGKRETLIRITSLLVPNTLILLQQFNPQSMIIIPQGPVSFDPYFIAQQFLQKAAAAGEWLGLGWTLEPIASTLMLGYSRGLGTRVPTVAQSPGWSGNGGTPIDGGLLGGLIGIIGA